MPFTITEPGTEFISEENVTVLTSSSRVHEVMMYLLNNRIILTKKHKQVEKYIDSVSFKCGTSIMVNE